jgi:hypothetical protein
MIGNKTDLANELLRIWDAWLQGQISDEELVSLRIPVVEKLKTLLERD